MWCIQKIISETFYFIFSLYAFNVGCVFYNVFIWISQVQVFKSCLCLVCPDWTTWVQSILCTYIHRRAGRENGTADKLNLNVGLEIPGFLKYLEAGGGP